MKERGAVVATRKVKKITESLCGLSFSKSQVSEIVKKLDTEIQAWLNRPLEEEYPYVFVDARLPEDSRNVFAKLFASNLENKRSPGFGLEPFPAQFYQDLFNITLLDMSTPYISVL